LNLFYRDLCDLSFGSPDFRLGVRAGHDAGCPGAGPEAAQGPASVRGGGPPAVQADGLLLQGGAQLRGEGGDDLLCEAAHSGARRGRQSARPDDLRGHGGGRAAGPGAVLRLHHAGHHGLLCFRQSARDWQAAAALPGRLAACGCRLCGQQLHLPRAKAPPEGEWVTQSTESTHTM